MKDCVLHPIGLLDAVLTQGQENICILLVKARGTLSYSLETSFPSGK